MSWIFFAQTGTAAEGIAKGLAEGGLTFVAGILAVVVVFIVRAYQAQGRELLQEKDKRIVAEEANRDRIQKVEREHSDKIQDILEGQLEIAKGTRDGVDTIKTMLEKGARSSRSGGGEKP